MGAVVRGWFSRQARIEPKKTLKKEEIVRHVVPGCQTYR
jgi:hypothetical protein